MNFLTGQLSPSPTHPVLLNRALGAFLGVAVGDALGATVEFMTAEEIAAQFKIHNQILGGGWLHLRPGQVTDDTAMSLVLGSALIANGGWNLRAIADAFVTCASGGRSKQFEKCLREAAPGLPEESLVKEGFDFAEIAEAAPALKPDFLIGSSKGYSIARRLKVPLIRVGFPIHDRIGGQRVLHLGYRGALEIYDRVVNALLEVKQEKSPVGYSYL